MPKKTPKERLTRHQFKGKLQPTSAQKRSVADALSMRLGIPQGHARQLLKVNQTDATALDIAEAVIAFAEGLSKRM